MVRKAFLDWFLEAAFSQLWSRRASLQSRRLQLEVEFLEDRLTPVIGANGLASVVNPGDAFDGVVRVGVDSGSLVNTARHILTAAHALVVPQGGQPGDSATAIHFNLARPGGNNIPISITVPGNTPGNQFQTVHPGWTGNFSAGNDLAILRLTDQEPGFQQANRHLVAPFTAQRYEFFAGNPVGQNFTIVGYGMSGIGNDGNHADEVQRVQINGAVGGGTFTLTFNGQTTAAIPQNATAA